MNLPSSRKAKRFVKALSMTAIAVALVVTVSERSVHAEGHSCEQGQSCELGAKPPSTRFAPGKVDGVAVWQSDGHANLWFTTTASRQHAYQVAVCGAASVEEVMFEDGIRKDTKIASPKGKLSGCDLYALQTGMRLDGLRVKPKGNSFKLMVRKNGQASGYAVYLDAATLAARETHYHFRMDHEG